MLGVFVHSCSALASSINDDLKPVRGVLSILNKNWWCIARSVRFEKRSWRGHYLLQKRMTIIGWYIFYFPSSAAQAHARNVFWQAMRQISGKDYIWVLSTWLFFGRSPRMMLCYLLLQVLIRFWNLGQFLWECGESQRPSPILVIDSQYFIVLGEKVMRILSGRRLALHCREEVYHYLVAISIRGRSALVTRDVLLWTCTRQTKVNYVHCSPIDINALDIGLHFTPFQSLVIITKYL